MYSQELFDKAEVIGNNPTQLKSRLKEGISVLKDKYRKEFKDYTFDSVLKRLQSNTSPYYLQWNNKGNNSVGQVSLYKKC